MTEKKKLSVESYKGTRDFYPEDMAVQKYIFDTMRKAVESFGYVEYGASIIEETDLYRAKSGEEIVNEQTYTFVDRGGRDVTIRPEMTPTVARMVAKKRKELVFPLRWYSIPNLFRYERPQRGRLREHWQLNVDLFGVDSVSADSEVIEVSHRIMRSFGATNEDFRIKVNHRELLNYVLHDYVGANDEVAYALSKLIDRKAKMPEADFRTKVVELVGDTADRLFGFMETDRLEALSDEFQKLPSVKQLRELMETLEKRGMVNVEYDPTIMRGFDYYTGIVFELHDTNPENNRSLFGGGRYDDLVGLFGVEKVSGVGFGAGDVTMHDFLETRGLIKDVAKSTVDCSLCLLSRAYEEHANMLAMYLRERGLNIEIDFSERKLVSQIKTADKHGVRHIVCIGENELKTETYTVKDLRTGEEKALNRDMLWEYLLAMRGA